MLSWLLNNIKGIEEQTKKLFKVVKKRGMPIFIFIKKLDRDGYESLELLTELEKLLDIESYSIN